MPSAFPFPGLNITGISINKPIFFQSVSVGQASRVSKTHSQRPRIGSTTTQSESGETSLSTSSAITSAQNTSTFPASVTSTASTLSTRPELSRAGPSQKLETPPATSTPRPRTSLLNSLPSERPLVEPSKTLSDKPPVKQTTYKPLAVAPSASIRPETNSKMAVCLPNKASRTESSLTRAVYVPREINLGATDLRLEDCINVKDICDKELTKWTAEDVAKFVRATDCSEYAHVFVDQVSEHWVLLAWSLMLVNSNQPLWHTDAIISKRIAYLLAYSFQISNFFVSF